MQVIVDCEVCGKPFELSRQRMENNKHHCCSKECMGVRFRATNNVQCSVCAKPFHLKPSHLAKRVNPGDITCSYDCGKVARSKRMVGELNHQFGVKGPENSSWVSGIRVGPNGYVLVKNYTHPYRTCDDDIRLHRLIMEHYLRATHQYRFLQEIEGGWYLNPEFDVHHVDENRLNNSLSNLEVMTRGEHTALHNAARSAKGKLADSGQSTGSQLTKNVRLDAGLDILSCVKTTILAGGSQIISTGIKINVPDGFVGLIWSRSGLSVKHKIEVGAGCIDSGYTGEVLVHLYNLGDKAYEVNIGQKIAQLLTIPVNLDFYERVASLEDSERGDNGFGSTGDFVQ